MESRDWSSDVCSSDLTEVMLPQPPCDWNRTNPIVSHHAEVDPRITAPCRSAFVQLRFSAPDEGRILACGAALLHTWARGCGLKLVWSHIAPHKPRTPARYRRAEHRRATHISQLLVCSITAPHKQPRLPEQFHLTTAHTASDFGRVKPCERIDRKSTRLNSSHEIPSRMPSSA